MTLLELPCTEKKLQLEKSNEELAFRIIQELYAIGVKEWVLCAGKRNAPLFALLTNQPLIKVSYWFDERSAAFFALGRARASEAPIALLTTSGTAAAEPLPAVMEAYYSGVPLVVVTGDRPRRFAHTGAPQCVEQVGIFGLYAPEALDLAVNEPFHVKGWQQRTPMHLNVRFEEPKATSEEQRSQYLIKQTAISTPLADEPYEMETVETFLSKTKRPLVIVSTLPPRARQAVKHFLLQLNAPVYFEGISGLREDPELDALAIRQADRLLKTSTECGYAVDSVIRIGGVPTLRLWRDLEEMQSHLPILSIAETPFPGVTNSPCLQVWLDRFFYNVSCDPIAKSTWASWKDADQCWFQKLQHLFEQEPLAEASMFYQLSKQIPTDALVYLGNSLPIREWDLAATIQPRVGLTCANRGVNGIDGQVSTFLGLAQPNQSNWGIFGDLTFLYDLSAPAQLVQFPQLAPNFVVVNNGGGKFFARFFSQPEFQCSHNHSMRPMAEMWQLEYTAWKKVPEHFNSAPTGQLIEMLPNPEASERFWCLFKNL